MVDSSFWQEEKDPVETYTVPKDIVDLNFRVKCRQLPLDHAHELSVAVCAALPWIKDEPKAAIHLIHGAESGNGWIRPQNPQDIMFLSRRTLFSLRLPQERLQFAQELAGKTLQVAGEDLTLSAPTVRPLSKMTTLFSRYIIDQIASGEDEFLHDVARQLGELGISVKKMLCGRAHELRFPKQKILARSLMVDGLTVPESVKLQEQGIGEGLKIGCGIFLPHKGIDPVGDQQEK